MQLLHTSSKLSVPASPSYNRALVRSILSTDLVLDGGGVQHGDVVHGDPLPDDPLAPPLELQLAVAVGEVQQPDGVLGREVHGVGVEVEEEGAVDGVAEVADIDAALHTPLLPVVLAER